MQPLSPDLSFRLESLAFTPVDRLDDDDLVAMLARADFVFAAAPADDDADGGRVTATTEALGRRALAVARDTDGCPHGTRERRIAALQLLAAVQADYGTPAAVAVTGPVREWDGLSALIIVPAARLGDG
jgi:hypothetical protein